VLTHCQTKHLQDALAECGWEDAARVCQQDASEAFTFITGALELPLLTLKMDIYHTGREDKEDDHKFVNERLLEVAIPEQEGEGVITLEDCLETYFNNRIEVKRFLQRQNTIGSMRSIEREEVDRDPEKNETIHVESIELSAPDSPIVTTPVSIAPSSPSTLVRPQINGRRRADSIFSQRMKNAEDKRFDEKRHMDDMWNNSSGGRPRSASLLRKEVLMPAWQFFSLIRKPTPNIPWLPLISFSLVYGQRPQDRRTGGRAFFESTPCLGYLPQTLLHDYERHSEASQYVYRYPTRDCTTTLRVGRQNDGGRSTIWQLQAGVTVCRLPSWRVGRLGTLRITDSCKRSRASDYLTHPRR